MADKDFERDNDNSESKLREPKTEKAMSSCCVVKMEEDETEAEPAMVVSPKNRRKIRQPKQYKPKSPEDQEPNGIDGNSEDTQGSLSNSPSSPVDPPERTESNGSLENEAHVIPASQGPKQVGSRPLEKRKPASQKSTSASQKSTPASHKSTSASQKSTPVSQKPCPTSQKPCPTSQKPKRSGARKTKHQNPTVPKKPEDLIREALLSGQSSSQATKRDAQYRKSYAYKIWKEKANCEVTPSGSTEQGALGPETQQGAGSLVSVNQQNQERMTYYWPPKQHNEQPGFYTNGKYYKMNPQVSYGVQSIPQIPHTTSTVPQINHISVATTAELASPTSVVHTSSPVPTRLSQDATYHRGEYVFEKGPVNRNMMKTGPPNVVVVQQYPRDNRVSPPVPNSTSGPPAVNSSYPQRIPATGHQPPVSAPNITQPIATQSPSPETLASAMPRKEPTEPKVNGVSKSPSNLVSLVKSSLKMKHCKENVQPVTVSFKSKLKSKRKLETDKAELGPAKKSAKPTIFTPLNEQEAEKLANDIYDVNLEYFPFQILAEKAAKTKDDETVKAETKNRVTEIEKVRCLLKDFYDVTYSCTEDPDMQKFDSASRKFGRKNILNHLSLLDRYFAELQKKVDCSS